MAGKLLAHAECVELLGQGVWKTFATNIESGDLAGAITALGTEGRWQAMILRALTCFKDAEGSVIPDKEWGRERPGHAGLMLQMRCAGALQSHVQFAGTRAVLRGAAGPHTRRLPKMERGEAAGGEAPLCRVPPRPQEVPGSRLGHRIHGRRELAPSLGGVQ